MPTAPTLVASWVANTTTGTNTSSSLSLQAGDIVVVLGMGAGGVVGDAINAPTTTFANGGITALQTHAASSNCEGRADTFTVSTTASGTVTQGHTANNNATPFTTMVLAFRNGVAPTVGRSSQQAGSGRTVNYTPSQADSAIVWIEGDWAQAAVQTVTPTPTTHTTSTPGPSALPFTVSPATQYTAYAQELDDQTGTGAVAYGIGGTGTGPFTIIVVEVQGTGGAVASTPRPPVPIIRNAVRRAAVI